MNEQCEVTKAIGLFGIIPTVVIKNVDQAVPLARALIASNLSIMQVSFRTEAAMAAIQAICKEFPNMLVGASDIITPEQVNDAAAGGAKFLTTAGFNPKVVKQAEANSIVIYPGVTTNTDVEKALELGIRNLNFYTTTQNNDVTAMVNGLCSPYENVRGICTNRYDPKTMTTLLTNSNVLACATDFTKIISEKDWEEKVSHFAKTLIDLVVLGHVTTHVGINCQAEPDAVGTANYLAKIFGLEMENGGGSVWIGEGIEVMKVSGRGEHGHIAIRTNNVRRSMHYMGLRDDVKFAPETFNEKDGVLISAYLQHDIGGFAFHLLQRGY